MPYSRRDSHGDAQRYAAQSSSLGHSLSYRRARLDRHAIDRRHPVLDVLPVNLLHSDPPWLEQEISTIPTPPISGTVNQACIELQNPLGVSRQVTVTFKEADFGAGIGFHAIRHADVYTAAQQPAKKHCVN
ncbi:MAG: hypothetical protein U0559_01825 [Anaerolineae bacterium]